MGPPGGGGPGVAGLGLFVLVRRSAGQGHGQKPPVTLPRFATLESARSIHCPSMGLLRRPTPGEIVEGGRFSRPYGPGALSRAISENQPAAAPLRRISRGAVAVGRGYQSTSLWGRPPPDPGPPGTGDRPR